MFIFQDCREGSQFTESGDTMIFKFEAQAPKIDEKAYAFNTATLIGKVELKEYASVWPGVTIRGDVNRIEVGRYSNIQDNSVLHVADNYACIVGDYVTVGHCALLHACTVEDHCLIGMHSTVLDGAVIGHGSIVAAGAVVTKGPRALRQTGYNWLGSDRFVEDGSFVRLNYTQLSYSFEPKFIKKFGLSMLNLYLSANNLFCLTKYSGADPEVSYGNLGIVTDKAKTPRAKSFTDRKRVV